MEGDFSWLWRNEDLSDFTLLIRERPVGSIQAATPEDPGASAAAAAAGGGGGDAAAAAAAAAAGGGGGEDGDHRQTRAGKRRRVSAPAAPAAPDTAAAAAAGVGGRNTRSRRSLQQPPLPPQHNNAQQGGGAGGAPPNIQLQQAEGQEQQQAGARPFVQRFRQHAQNQRVAAAARAAGAAGGGGAGPADAGAGAAGVGNNGVVAPQAAAGRATRRTSRQNRQQQQQQDEQQAEGQQEQNHQQQQQQPAQQVDQQQQQQQQGGITDGGRRTRRSSAARGGRQVALAPPPAAAAAAPGQQDDHDAAAAAAGDEQQPGQPANPAAAAAAAAAAGGGGDGGGEQPTGRATRSSRSKKRTSEAAAAAAAAGGGAGAGAAARTRGAQQQQQRGSDPGSSDGAPAAGRRSQRRQAAMQQLQHSMQQLTTEGSDGGAAAGAAAGGGVGGGGGGGSAGAAAANTTQQQQQEEGGLRPLFPAAPGDEDLDDIFNAPLEPAVEIRVPVHAVVLAGFSEYFKALICSWSNHLNRILTLDVGPDEGNAALLMVQFMYTGKLPDASPEELLKMVRLADQYQVSRFMAAASHSFESLPLTTITQNVMLEVFRLPQLMLDAPEMSRVVAKARAKLLDLYGDLEKVWACETLREQFLALPFPAVRCLLASDATQVAAENTALVVLAGWVEEGPQGHRSTTEQLKELLGLIRLPYLTASFVGDVLHAVPWVNDLLDSRQLLNAFQFAIASESTRQRLAAYDYGPSSLTPHFRCPRPTSSVTRCSFDWSFELSTVKRMVADAQLWGRVVELSSPLHYFAGFWWQLLFNVEKSPTPPDAPPEVAAAQPSVIEFVGVRCHVNCGAHDYWPRVVRFKASISALQTGFWEMDFAYQKAIEGPIVDGVGLGYPGFFALPGQALDNEAAWSRFVRGGRVHLRCEVTDCE